MKVAIISDTHAGVRNGSSVFIDHQETFYRDVFFPYLDRHKIKTILHLGDYFDNRKNIDFRVLNANRKHFLEPMRDRGITMDIIPGNHDIYYKNTTRVCSLKELLGHFTSNINIIMNPRVMTYGSMHIAMLPWITPENHDESMSFIESCRASWLCGHLELNGFEMQKGVEMKHGMDAGIFSRFDRVLSGHYHTKSQKGNVMYLGTQMEFTWSDVDDPKYFHVLDTETQEITPVRNPNTIFKRYAYDDEKTDPDSILIQDLSDFENKYVKVIVVKKNDTHTFDKFIDRLNSEIVTHEVKVGENYNEFLGSRVDMDDAVGDMMSTTDLLSVYVDSSDTALDKGRLKKVLQEVHAEAINIDFE